MRATVSKAWRWSIVIFCMGLAACISFFPVEDTDFWWHLKAGQIMRSTGSIISTDPFAFTRVGEAYLATHEWLSQIFFSIFFDAGGATGVIALRMTLVLLTFGVLLLLDRRRAWVNVLLVPFAVATIRHAIADRPQMFTFALLALAIAVLFTYLQTESWRRRRRILLYYPVLILLWSNMHGAAALVGVGLLGCVLLQRIADYVRVRSFKERQEVYWLGGAVVASVIALVCTPSGFHTLGYLLGLQTDNSIEFIREWQPNEFDAYMMQLWYLWVIAIAALLLGRAHLIFSVLVLLSIGYLSKTAIRHEPLFVITALAVTYHQLRYAERWHSLLAYLQQQKVLGILLLLSVLNLGAYRVYTVGYDAGRQFQLYGGGTFEPAEHAYAFVESENIQGNGFNNYDIGAYLLYKGYPNRKVFLDGRNLDYGYEYIRKAIDADLDTGLWNELENTYDFTYAVIFYGPQVIHDPIPYTDHLDQNPNWALVYIDDWTAVYLKRTLENQSIISKHEYTAITPKKLTFHSVPEKLRLSELQTMQRELLRIADGNPEDVHALLYLALLSTMLQQYSDAEVLLARAQELEPHNYQVYQGLSTLAIEQGDYKNGYMYLKQAISKTGFTHRAFDEEYVESVKQKAEAL